MSAAQLVAGWDTGERYGSRARRRTLALGAIGLICALAYAIALPLTGGQPLLLAPPVIAIVGIAIFARPAAGVYLLFGAALLFEQSDVPGVAPLTDQSHIWQRLDAFTSVPLPLGVGDLLMLGTFLALLFRWLTRRASFRGGPFALPVAAYAAVFVYGLAIGMARGGPWNINAGLAEARAPLQMCLLYFLAANLIRERSQLLILTGEFVALVAVKALQGIWAYQEGLALPYGLEAVTGHEDVVFFDFAIAMLAVMVLLGVRTKLTYALLAIMPFVVLAEFFTQRRVAFVALGVVLVAVAIVGFASKPHRAFAFAGIAILVLSGYFALFWDEPGALGQPIRALRAAVDPASISVRDTLSDHWREIEGRNIVFTVQQLPITGVGVGQQYLIHEKPPEPGTNYWQYWTHNALMWLWLVAGPVGAFVLWWLVGQVFLTTSALFKRMRGDPQQWLVALPILHLTIQVVFSSIDGGLIHSRTMIVLGTMLGAWAFLFRPAGSGEPTP